MVKRSTWILLFILVFVLIAYILINRHSSLTKAENTPTAQGDNMLITEGQGTLQSIRISSKDGHVFQMLRDTSGAWIITFPAPGIADQYLAGAAETQVGALRIVSLIENQNNLKEYGLDSPADTLEITFFNGSQSVFQIGSPTPSNSGYYLLDDNGNLYVVSRSGIDALLNLLVTPPFAPSETPAPTAEVTTNPSPQVSPTP